jgi:hypothetical protein
VAKPQLTKTENEILSLLDGMDEEDLAEFLSLAPPDILSEIDRLLLEEGLLFVQPGPQQALLLCKCDEIFYGGQRGGGKSYGLLMDWKQHGEKYRSNATGLIVRRTFPELEELIFQSQVMYTQLGARYHKTERTWRHPEQGWRLKFRHLDKDSDADNYIGHQYTYIGVEEAGIFPSSSPIDKLRATLRSPAGVPVRMVLTGNPGGAGHNWLKSRYIDAMRPNEPLTETMTLDGEEFEWTRIFIPSALEDNKILMKNDPRYKMNLAMVGTPWLVKAWLSGDWSIVAGGFFDSLFSKDPETGVDRSKRIILPWFKIPSHWRVFRSFDWGSTSPLSVGWWAESDGMVVNIPQLGKTHLPRGSIIRIAEWYGWTGKANEGIELSSKEIATEIKRREKRFHFKVRPGPADASIFTKIDGPSIASKLQKNGVRFISTTENSVSGRVNGWDHMRNMLLAAICDPREEPGMFVLDTCLQWKRTIPMLPRDSSKPDDVDTNSEDHIADETRYMACRKSHTYRLKGLRP